MTYGVGAFYNPAHGTFGRYGYAYGPYRGIAGGAAYNPRTGTYVRGGVAYGPAGSRGFVTAYNPRTGNGAVVRGGTNVYGSWGTAAVRHGDELTRVRGGATDNAAGLRWKSSDGDRGFLGGGKEGDIYAGRDGNVYRRHDGEWQKRTPDGWGDVDRALADRREDAGQTLKAKRPEAADRIEQRKSHGPAASERSPARPQVRERLPDNLGPDRAARDIGNQRDRSREFRGGKPRRFEDNRRSGGSEFRNRPERRSEGRGQLRRPLRD